MEGIGSSNNSQDMFGKESGAGGLVGLQKQHEEKIVKIQELKKEIESAKNRLQNRKKEIPEEQMEAFKSLTDKYNRLRDDYNALLADRPTKSAALE